MKILGIETSCDETAAALVNDKKEILSNLVLSQLEAHEIYGGVVPEIAARAHLDHLNKLIINAMDEAKTKFSELDGVAATCGPGLIGGVMVGMMAGKAIAAAHNLPFMAVNHLEGHALTPRLTNDLEFPYLLLLASGGHTQILVAEDVGTYKQLGSTIDDALGECFDKSAKLMGLPYPGGPNLEKTALKCSNPQAAIDRFSLPTPMKGRKGCDFSFSGLKTAMRNQIEKLPQGPLKMEDVAALSYAFEHSVCEVVTDRCKNAIHMFLQRYKDKTNHPTLVVSGGVAANKALRNSLKRLTQAHEMSFIAPPVKLCSDNGAMIAWAGIERLQKGYTDPLDMAARPRWPLDPEAEQKRRVETV